MKILIISRTPWNNSNSFGNTFSNLFEGMKNVEVYNICCQNGEMRNTVVKSAFQMTDKAVLRSIYKRKSKTGWVMSQEVEGTINELNQQVSVEATKKRKITSLIIRDIIWKLGNWKKDPGFLKFLEEINPDIIYLPIYASLYMCNVQSFVVKKLNIPVIGHISDDVYGCPPKASPLARWYRSKLKKVLHHLIKDCSYLEVFAQNMKEEYEKIFNKPCYLIGKGVRVQDIPRSKYRSEKKDKLSFVYTGNIGAERYKVLYEIGKALEKISEKQKAILYIYSATELNKEMQEIFSSCSRIQFMGKISRDEVERVQDAADFLVHVESFSSSAIFATKMSFSTKIIDYMMKGKPIFAVGPKEVNSIQVLNNGLAIVATSVEEILEIIEKMICGAINIDDILDEVNLYLTQQRNIEIIQAEMKTRFDALLSS